jgi:hypothetical protein
MEWIKQFREKYQSFKLEQTITKKGMDNIEAYISNEIIEGIIEDIPTNEYIDGAILRKNLKDKWLNNHECGKFKTINTRLNQTIKICGKCGIAI